MADILDDIFPNDDEVIDRDTLMKYLDGSLPPDEKHRVEVLLLGSDLLNDAVEGIQQSASEKKLPAIENELKAGLEKLLKKRDNQRTRKVIKEMPWLYIVIIIVILLLLISFVVVRSYL